MNVLLITDKDEALAKLSSQTVWVDEVNLSDQLADDIDVITAAVNNNPYLVQLASKRLLYNEELFSYSISKNPRVFVYFHRAIYCNIKLVIKLLDSLLNIVEYRFEQKKIYETLFEVIPQSVKVNNEVSLKLTLLCFSHYKYLTDEQKNDKYFTITLVKRHRNAIIQIPNKFKEDREIILATISKFPLDIRFFSQEVRSDKEIALVAVNRNAGALKYLSIELKDDYDVIKAAIEKTGLAIQYASQRLRSSEELALIALYRNIHWHSVLEVLDISLYSNINVMKKATCKTADFEKAVKLASESLLSNPEIIKAINITLEKDKINQLKQAKYISFVNIHNGYISTVKETLRSLLTENPEKYKNFANTIFKKINEISV